MKEMVGTFEESSKGPIRTQTGPHPTHYMFQAEGIVARPKVELLSRTGERIITKIKHKDFQS